MPERVGVLEKIEHGAMRPIDIGRKHGEKAAKGGVNIVGGANAKGNAGGPRDGRGGLGVEEESQVEHHHREKWECCGQSRNLYEQAIFEE